MFSLKEDKGEAYLKKKAGLNFMAPAVGLEPTTDRLTADCSTTELRRMRESIFIKLQNKMQAFFLKFCIFLVKLLYDKILIAIPFF